MELRRVTEVLFRSKGSLVTASTTTKWQAGRKPVRDLQSSARSFSSSFPHRAPRSWATTSSAPRPSLHPSSTSSTTPQSQASPDQFEEINQRLGWTRAGHTPLKVSNSHLLPGLERKLNNGSSADELLQAAIKAAPTLTKDKVKAAGFNIANMNFPSSVTSASTPVDVEAVAKDIALLPNPSKVSLRLTPATGRTVHITDNIDLTTAIRRMEGLCTRNGVRKDFNRQRFHERPGLKRKRLRRERWRRNFKDSFKATVGRVQVLRKQGW